MAPSSVFHESTQPTQAVVEYFFGHNVVLSCTTKSFPMGQGSAHGKHGSCATQAFATALQLIQNADVVLSSLHLVNCAFFCRSPSALHKNPRVLDRLVHIDQTVHCRHSFLIQVVRFMVRVRVLLVRGAQVAFSPFENPLQCPQMFL